MECPKCVEENELSKKTNGYGCGYIGKRFNCIRHNNDNNSSTNNKQNTFISPILMPTMSRRTKSSNQNY